MSPPLPEQRLGATIADRYRLDSVLGQGGMGVVFGATHVLTRRLVALKLLSKDYAADRERVRRFLREARAQVQLAHPNVVDVLDMGETAEGEIYLALERLNGETLAQKIEREPVLSPRETFDILLPIMAAVSAAHDLGLVHRDLKPSNIFLSQTPEGVRPKLLDFGIVKDTAGPRTAKLTNVGEVLGTPSFMSPEQADGKPDIGPAADVWSMGVVFYRCLTGKVPFQGKTAVAVMMNITGGVYEPIDRARPELPRSVCDAIQRAIQLDPGKRYPKMGDFLTVMHRLSAELALASEDTLDSLDDLRPLAHPALAAAAAEPPASLGFASLPPPSFDDVPEPATEATRPSPAPPRPSPPPPSPGRSTPARSTPSSPAATWPPSEPERPARPTSSGPDRPAMALVVGQPVAARPPELGATRPTSEPPRPVPRAGRENWLGLAIFAVVAIGGALGLVSIWTRAPDVEATPLPELPVAPAPSPAAPASAGVAPAPAPRRSDAELKAEARRLQRSQRGLAAKQKQQVAALDRDFTKLDRQLKATEKLWQERPSPELGASLDQLKIAHAQLEAALRECRDEQALLLAKAGEVDQALAAGALDRAVAVGGEVVAALESLVPKCDPADVAPPPALAAAPALAPAAPAPPPVAAPAPPPAAPAAPAPPPVEEGKIRLSPPPAAAAPNGDALAREEFSAGEAHRKARRYDQAIAAYDRAIAAAPDFLTAVNARGLSHQAMGRHDAAIADFTRAIALDPNNAALYFNRAISKHGKKRRDDAILDLTEALRLRPDDSGTLFHRGLFHYEAQRHALAIPDLSQAIALNPLMVEAYQARAYAREKSGDRAGAIEDWTWVIGERSKSADPWLRRGSIYADERKTAEAIADFTKALELEPANTSALLRRGFARAEAGDKAGAEQDLRRYLELDPQSRHRGSVERQLEALTR